MKDYSPTIYIRNPDNSHRFALGIEGDKPLLVFGLNPSTASDTSPDRTMSKVMNHATLLGFNGFFMLNLYPQRATYPENLDREIDLESSDKNTAVILELAERFRPEFILAAWGQTILVRPYLIKCLHDIYSILPNLKNNWYSLGSLTKNGHPRHPSRTAYSCKLKPFDIETYLRNHSCMNK